jgi:hypothetical protein
MEPIVEAFASANKIIRRILSCWSTASVALARRYALSHAAFAGGGTPGRTSLLLTSTPN